MRPRITIAPVDERIAQHYKLLFGMTTRQAFRKVNLLTLQSEARYNIINNN